jgi:hypothetical protein
MREDNLLIFDRGAVVLLDIGRLREMVQRWLSPLRARTPDRAFKGTCCG